MKLTPATVSQLHPGVPIQEIVEGKFSALDISHIDDISACIGLRKIDLSQNKLASNEALTGIQYNKGMTYLNLAKNELPSCDAVRHCKKLVVLNVSHNALVDVPFWLKYFDALKALILNNNRIKDVQPSVWAPVALTTIVLSNNAIEDLSGFARCRRLGALTKLSLSTNAIRTVPPHFAEALSSLRELRLAENKITAIAARLLPPSLEILDLSHNRIKSFSDIECLRELPHLVNLSMKGCPICSVDGYATKMREMLPALRILDGVRFDERFLMRKRRKQSFNEAENEAKRRASQNSSAFCDDDERQPKVTTHQ